MHVKQFGSSQDYQHRLQIRLLWISGAIGQPVLSEGERLNHDLRVKGNPYLKIGYTNDRSTKAESVSGMPSLVGTVYKTALTLE